MERGVDEVGEPSPAMAGQELSLESSPLHTSINRSGRGVSLRGIRRCTNVECGGPDAHHELLWNRDHNAAINIRQNLLHRLEHGRWDPLFSVGQHSDTTTNNNNRGAAVTAPQRLQVLGRILCSL